MVGRRRGLRPAINSSDKWMRARAERAAINTPIQGSAADVASAAMLSIVQDKVLKELDWKLLLQVRLFSCHTDLAFEGWILGFGITGV
jgi:DNA polymerase-1